MSLVRSKVEYYKNILDAPISLIITHSENNSEFGERGSCVFKTWRNGVGKNVVEERGRWVLKISELRELGCLRYSELGGVGLLKKRSKIEFTIGEGMLDVRAPII